MKQLILCDSGNVGGVAPLCKTHGAGIEIQSFFDPQVLEQFPETLEQHKQAVKGLAPVALQGCFCDLCPGSFDALVRKVARERFEQNHATAVELGARHVVLPHGYVPQTSSPLAWVKRSTAFWYEFLEGKDHAIKIHLENALDQEPKVLSDVVRLISRDNLDICLNIGQLHCHSKSTIIQWIEYLGPQIGYVHLHDNNGQEDEHLGLGMGTIRLQDVCRALSDYAPNATWALDAEGEGLQISIEWLQRNGYLKGHVM